jgi:hypothetical protein
MEIALKGGEMDSGEQERLSCQKLGAQVSGQSQKTRLQLPAFLSFKLRKSQLLGKRKTLIEDELGVFTL